MSLMDQVSNRGAGELPERWSAKRKAEVVPPLLRGEDRGAVSREIQVAPHVLEEWRRGFFQGGITELKTRGGDPLENELQRSRAKLEETLMKPARGNRLAPREGGVGPGVNLRRELGRAEIFAGSPALARARPAATGDRPDAPARTDLPAFGFGA